MMVLSPICVLDIDGVLNRFTPIHPVEIAPRFILETDLVARLDAFLRETGASILWSTSWRRRVDLSTLLTRFGVDALVLGTTPCYEYNGRAERALNRLQEIKDALRTHPGASYVIFDDMPMGHPYQCVIDPITGLTNEDIARAKSILLSQEGIVCPDTSASLDSQNSKT